MVPSEALLHAARQGDRDALQRLLVLHRDGIFRYGLTVCRTTEDTEDAVQETLWAATRALRTFRGTATTFARWLFTIVRHECFRMLERGRRTSDLPPHLEATMETAVDVEDEVAVKRRAEVLAEALAAIDETHREVILLRDVRELSAPQAASLLGISVDALKSRLHRARASLRAETLRRSPN